MSEIIRLHFTCLTRLILMPLKNWVVINNLISVNMKNILLRGLFLTVIACLFAIQGSNAQTQAISPSTAVLGLSTLAFSQNVGINK